jgi:RNA polymerase sigma factor (sigma-70 family)
MQDGSVVHTQRRSGQSPRQSYPARCNPRPREYRLRQTEPLLTALEEQDLGARVQAGDRAARDRLITANLRFAQAIAARFRSPGMTRDDLEQEAIRGLIKAVDAYNPAQYKTRFSTYAAWWITHYLRRSQMSNISIVRIPQHLFRLAIGRQKPAAGLTRHQVANIRRAQAAARAFPRIAEWDEDQSSGLIDTPPAPTDTEELAALQAAMGELSVFEDWLIRNRYGIPPVWPELPQKRGMVNYSELARVSGLTVHQVRQVMRIALAKLRNFLCRHDGLREID